MALGPGEGRHAFALTGLMFPTDWYKNIPSIRISKLERAGKRITMNIDEFRETGLYVPP